MNNTINSTGVGGKKKKLGLSDGTLFSLEDNIELQDDLDVPEEGKLNKKGV